MKCHATVTSPALFQPYLANCIASTQLVASLLSMARALHTISNKSLKLQNALRDRAASRGDACHVSTLIGDLLRNAADLRATLDVELLDAILPISGNPQLVPLADIKLPQAWLHKIDELIERESPGKSRITVRSKARYAVWNLKFEISLAALVNAVALQLSRSQESSSPGLPGDDRLKQSSKRIPASAMNGHAATKSKPASPGRRGNLVEAGATDRIRRTGPSSDVHDAASLGDFKPSFESLQRAAAIGVGSSPERLPTAENGRNNASKRAREIDRDKPEAVAFVASAEIMLTNQRPKLSMSKSSDYTNMNTAGQLSRHERHHHAAEQFELSEDDNASSAGRTSSEKPVSSVRMEPIQIFFDAPPGSGSHRVFEGTAYFYDPELDAWMTETAVEKAQRVDDEVSRLLSAEVEIGTEPWQAFLPIAAALPLSRRIANAVLGNYAETTGLADLAYTEFSIGSAPPVSRLDMRHMLEKQMSVLWAGTKWAERVLSNERSVLAPDIPPTWNMISQRDRLYDAALANWVVVDPDIGVPPFAISTDSQQPFELRDRSNADFTRSRFQDVADALASRPPDRVGRRSTLTLGPGGTGKSYELQRFMNAESKRLENRIIPFNICAADIRRDRPAFETLCQDMAIAEARGYTCAAIIDEAQHLTAYDLEKLQPCSIVKLAGDIQQTGTGARAHPIVAFARCIGADIQLMHRVWRASNTSLFNAISYTFYDSSNAAIGRGDGQVEASTFYYDICVDDCEIIAARLWAASRQFKASDKRSLMIVIERDDIRRAINRIAGSDHRRWQQSSGSVTIVHPSAIQGKEADVLLFLPSDFAAAFQDVDAAVRGFLTLMGRAREAYWLLFTRKPELDLLPQRVFASLLRSFLETRVSSPLPPLIELEPKLIEPIAHLGLTFHEFDTMALLSFRGCAFAVYDWTRHHAATKDEIDQRELIKQKGWSHIQYDQFSKFISLSCISKLGKSENFSHAGVETEIRRRMAQIDVELDCFTSHNGK